MFTKKLAIIGVGNMGSAIVAGLLAKKTIQPQNLILFDPASPHVVKYKKHGAVAAKNLHEAVKNAEIVLLAVKPQIFPTLLADLKKTIKKDQLIISIAAGVEIKSIKKIIGNSQPVIRVMPNLCATVQEAISVWIKSPEVSPDYQLILEKILNAFGKEIELKNEALMDAVTAISGSGPAYIFYLCELLEESALKLGLPQDLASVLARQTVVGSAVLLSRSDLPAKELRRQVTSKGGTTEAAIETFENNKLDELFFKGIKAAENRSKKLK